MKLLCLVCILGCFAAVNGSAKAVIDAGLSAGNALAEAFAGQEFSNVLANVAQKISPFLGMLGPIVSLVTVFLPKGEDENLRYLKQEFAKVDANFDKVFINFKDVSSLIKETELKVMYSNHEMNINSLSTRLRIMLEASDADVKSQMDNFMDAYNNYYHHAAYKLWEGMTQRDLILAENIPKIAKNITQFNRKKVQHLMIGILDLIIRGVRIHLVYQQCANRAFDHEKRLWEGRIIQLLHAIIDVDQEVVAYYETQAAIDVKDLAAIHMGKTHDQFANITYDTLTRKYDWVLWFVAVFDDVDENKTAILKTCHGTTLYKVHGFDVAISSMEYRSEGVNDEYLKWAFKSVKTYTTNWREVVPKAASQIFSELPKTITESCESVKTTITAVGVIKTDAKPVFRSPKQRTFVYVGNFFTFSAFR